MRLTPDFSSKEFQCRCGCGVSNVDVEFLTRLQLMRDLLKMPIVITCGYRCQKHNEAVGGVMTSLHTRGFAVDVICQSSRMRARLIEAALDAGMNEIGVYHGFLHIALDVASEAVEIFIGDKGAK